MSEIEIPETLIQKLSKVRGFAFDIDGVLTDGNVLLTSDGEWLRSVNIRDGFALKHAIEMRYSVAIITGSNSEALKSRFISLGIEDIYMEIDNKSGALEDFMFRRNLHYSEVLAMGDDIPELAMMLKAGVATCPNDADSEIKKYADYISQFNGGRGAVREVIEMVLRIHDKWPVLKS